MIKRDAEPFLWMLFSAVGVVCGMLMPGVVFLCGVAFPLGWLTPPTRDHMATLLANPLVALVLLGLIVLSLFHWAHRFRHTLYDGLQIKHLQEVIVAVSYGGAIISAAPAGHILWQARERGAFPGGGRGGAFSPPPPGGGGGEKHPPT